MLSTQGRYLYCRVTSDRNSVVYKHIHKRARCKIAPKNAFKLIGRFFESVKQWPQCVVYTFYFYFFPGMCCFWQGSTWPARALPANGIPLLWLWCLLSHTGLRIKQQLKSPQPCRQHPSHFQRPSSHSHSREGWLFYPLMPRSAKMLRVLLFSFRYPWERQLLRQSRYY